MSAVQTFSPPEIVRRFTDDLEPTSDLAIQTKSYQEDLDAEIEIKERLRLSSVIHQPVESSFTGVEIARKTLQAQCDEFFRSVEQKEQAGRKKSGVWRIFHRNGAERRLVQEIGDGKQVTVGQVNSITSNLEDKWKESNSKAATNFMKICQKLDAHKQIFQCFPSQSDYTSALCGAVTMIIQTSINYADIAEKLSTYVADLSESVAICTNWLDLYETADMKERLSAIYEQFFGFFIKVASWYLKPKGSKILDSFNSSFTTSYQGTVTKIERSIQLLEDQASIETAREIKTFLPAVTGSAGMIMAELRRNGKENNEAGKNMYKLLMLMSRRRMQLHPRPHLEQIELSQNKIHPGTTETITTEVLTIEATQIIKTTAAPEGVTRAEAEELCQHLQALVDQVGGSDGVQPALQTGRLVAEPMIIRMLGRWTTATSGDDLILWVISPYEHGISTSANLAAYGVIWSAIQAQAQFISYICQRPRFGRVPGFQGMEDKAAVLAMVYSLIRQLLQFQTPEDDLLLQRDMLDQLTQPGERWSSALALFRYLLEQTPSLRYLIISGVNVIESDAREMCREFVDMVLHCARNSEWPLRVLFTTAGQSRALSETVSKDSKILSSNTFRQAKGRVIYRDMDMSG
ncbi:hypothetical protein N7452_003909 [Penicillium brevicompactum]|uniref:DUF7708 domain-containing protein n=1 Tax=Penicillium brevicompactum TaxID=5074 RepID=A0A9W9QUF1_PENBR|nr:hypothetical protein N7452_003909 [Penicillium brevicompactum]